MSPRRGGGGAGTNERDWRARKIQGKVVVVDDDLGDVWILPLALVFYPSAQRAHHQRRVGCEWRNRFVDHRRLNQRFVSLDVDDERCLKARGDFCNSIGAALMPRRRHPRDAAECFNRAEHALVVGRNDDRRDRSRRRGPPIHMLDHWPAVDIRQRFSGKSE